MNLLLNKDYKVILLDPPKPKEHEIYLEELHRTENEKPCGILLNNGEKIAILRQDSKLIIQNMTTLEILIQDSEVRLSGMIDWIRNNKELSGIKKAFLFENKKLLKDWLK